MTFRMPNLFLVFSLLFCAQATFAQGDIKLRNASFEDFPRCCVPPNGWYACGGSELGTPDIQPGSFDVNLPAVNGLTYVGMVTRDNDTWESISQRLPRPLMSGQCYTFSLKIAYSDNLISQSRVRRVNVKYDTPIKVRIWGGNGYCNRSELLDETPLISNTEWKQYNFRFKPKRSFSYFIIEAFYRTPTIVPYNGNILVDDASVIELIPCDEAEEPEVVEVEQPDDPSIADVSPTPTPPERSRPRTDPSPDPGGSTSVNEDERIPEEYSKPSTNILKLEDKEIAEGQVIRIERLYFAADSSNLNTASYPVLNEIYYFLRKNPGIVIEIAGHTNNRCEDVFCNELSEKRALAVSYFLQQKGIPSRRLRSRGYGKSDPVASNTTKSGRKRNQRVEIKILSLDG